MRSRFYILNNREKERWQSLAECAALEMQYTLACIGGSNPSLSALTNDDKAL